MDIYDDPSELSNHNQLKEIIKFINNKISNMCMKLSDAMQLDPLLIANEVH